MESPCQINKYIQKWVYVIIVQRKESVASGIFKKGVSDGIQKGISL